MTERIRMEVEVVAERGGNTWDHTGTRQSGLFLLRDTATGKEYTFDSFARWNVGEIRKISAVVDERGSHFFGGKYIQCIEWPRPVKKI